MEAEHIRAIITEQFLSERETFDKKFNEATTLQAKQRVFKEFKKRIKLVLKFPSFNFTLE